MNLEEFRSLVYSEFGPDLSRATPANIRDFLNRLQTLDGSAAGPIVLNETHTTLESIMKDFFSRALTMPKDQALILLWTVGIELAFGMVEEHLSERLTPLFKGLED